MATKLMASVDFNVAEYAHYRNPQLKIFRLSTKTGEGIDAWFRWLMQ